MHVPNPHNDTLIPTPARTTWLWICDSAQRCQSAVRRPPLSVRVTRRWRRFFHAAGSTPPLTVCASGPMQMCRCCSRYGFDRRVPVLPEGREGRAVCHAGTRQRDVSGGPRGAAACTRTRCTGIGRPKHALYSICVFH